MSPTGTFVFAIGLAVGFPFLLASEDVVHMSEDLESELRELRRIQREAWPECSEVSAGHADGAWLPSYFLETGAQCPFPRPSFHNASARSLTIPPPINNEPNKTFPL